MNTVEAVKTLEEVEKVEALFRKHKGDLYGDIWRIGVNLALRISDLLALTYKDVEGEVLTVIEKKTGKKRMLKINSVARRVIDQRHQQHPNDDWLFQVHSNRASEKAVGRVTVAKAFKEVGDIIDIKLGSHSMRKSRGWAMYSAGVKLELISKVLGHSHPAVTMVYLGITQGEIMDTYTDFEL